MPNSRHIYAEDLAYIHDVGFSGLAESWSQGLLGLLQAAEIHKGIIVDLGCGGGGWVQHLTDAGYQAIGCDVSAAMIDRARQRVPKAEFHVGSVWDQTIPNCRAVTALSEVVCYRATDQPNPALDSLLHNVFRALEPGGLLIFDVAEVGLDRESSRTFSTGEDWACLVHFEYDDSQDRLHRHITTFRQEGTLYRRSVEQHIVQLYRGDDVATWLEEAGFDVRVARQFGDAPLLPNRVGFIASKPRE